ncbi:MAG: ATP-binding protein [Solirubrobacterales bacterium]
MQRREVGLEGLYRLAVADQAVALDVGEVVEDAAGGPEFGGQINWPVAGGQIIAAAMIDRSVHHAEILSLKGESFRLRGKALGPTPADVADL